MRKQKNWEEIDTRKTWNPTSVSIVSFYDAQSKKLAVLFQENFEQFKDQSPKKVFGAGPELDV